ncbi:MAG: hypothetical protein NZ455_16070 [Bacteroidia bacterium]|nr:hypothetical protein [Bacteroidia bacterium]MDW8348417.1 hypothetical protein [Bacteroidia bacterium]
MGVTLALMPTRSACYGLTVLRPARLPPGHGVKSVGEGLRTGLTPALRMPHASGQ